VNDKVAMNHQQEFRRGNGVTTVVLIVGML